MSQLKGSGDFIPSQENNLNACNTIHFFVELMNKYTTMLVMNNIQSQQNLNNRKEKLREGQYMTVDFSFGEWFVEKMLSKYGSVYKRITLPVQQFIVFTIIIKSVEKL